MTAKEIREKYLEFFKKRGHAIVPSSSLVPENDPTTLFTGSGMQPMVPYLLGAPHPLGMRVADSQKCFRSQDIEEVGDNRHTTFFEMLGNWSLGDYFKKEQIPWMWEFLTEELGLDPSRLYFTCFRGNEALGIPRDDESANLWQHLFRERGIDALITDFSERDGMRGARIFFYDEKKNWWSRSGIPGNMPEGEPGGPDTEMFWDFGEHLGHHESSPWKDTPCHVNCDCGRFMEIGNNVFMEYVKTADGFARLPKPNVDFGGGLERMAAAVHDNSDVFRVDIFDDACAFLEKLSGKRYGEHEKNTYAFRVILDHLRAAMFLIGDGVVPSNKDQGYFVRRLIRRAVRFAHRLGIEELFCVDVAKNFVAAYQISYPELEKKSESIFKEIKKEEEKFNRTFLRGEKIQNRENEELYYKLLLKERASHSGLSNEEIGTLLKERGFTTEGINMSATAAFSLETTHGYFHDLFLDSLEEKIPGAKKSLNEIREKIEEKLEEHRNLSRTASVRKFKGGLADHSEKTTALHTATHLMLAGLRKFLGDGVHQAGSNITEERTRFDFTSPEKVSREVLDQVEAYVNEAIQKGTVVKTEVMDKEVARASGVEGSFWEKYPEKVTVYRVVAPDGTVYSEELCGGPHVTHTSGMGRFRIVKEEASSAGVRRIKAVLESA